jgi:hypothetical protein
MIPLRPLVLSLVLLTLPMPGHATRVYQSKGPDGSTVFSDQPSPMAREIDIDLPPPAIPAPAPPAAAPAPARDADEAAEKKVVYTTVRIIEPANDAVHWFAEGPVKVQAQIVPPLAEGHVLVPLLNGVAQGSGVPASGFSLTGLDPDTYQLSVVIRDAQGKDLKQSPAIRFHFKRQSVNLPARRPPPRSGS